MLAEENSLYSSYSIEQLPLLQDPSAGSYRIKYNPHSEWDFHHDTTFRSIDLTLVLPHYRARSQPLHHRMNMFVGNESGSMKLKVCRSLPRLKFCLEVQASTSDVTIWLPSDFKGHIRHSGRATFSAGFTNRIMQNAHINEPSFKDVLDEDEVIVETLGRITFRMWDVQTCAPELVQKESIKRFFFGCSRKAPEATIDWDFLVEDQ